MKTDEFTEQMDAEGITPEAIPDDVFPVPTGEKGIIAPAEIIFSTIATDHEWFIQNDRVVEKAESFDDKGGRRIILKELTKERGLSELERLATKHGRTVARWEVRPDKKSGRVRGYWRADIMPESRMKELLETTVARKHLPRIAIITSAPLLVEDGKGGVEVLGHGYHPQGGGVFVDCEAEVPEVPLQAAVDALLALHGDFDFCTPADLSRAIGVSLSPALKTFIDDDFPMHVSEAVESQSGKDYLQKVHLRIYGESAMGITKSKGGVGSLDESIFNAILTGRRFLCIGNLRGELDSQVMEDAIRGHRFIQGRGYRMAGTVDTKPLIWQLSTNGAQFTRDIANRSIVTRIRKRGSGYKFREYPEGDLLAHIKANQAYYLGCVFAVIREWVSKGKPKTNDTRHDFRGWCQAVDWIVRNIFQLPPLLDGHKEQQDRTANPDLQWLRDLSNAILNLEREGEMFTAGGVAGICSEEGLSLPGVREGSEEKVELMIGRIMGRLYKNHGTKIDDEFSRIDVDGNTVTRHSREEYNEETRKTYLSHSYQFARAFPAANPAGDTAATCAPVRPVTPKVMETIRTSSVSVCFPEISPPHVAQAHREDPTLAEEGYGKSPAEVQTPSTPCAMQTKTTHLSATSGVWKKWERVISEINLGEGCGFWLAMPVRLERQEDTLTITINFVDGPEVVGGAAEKYYTDLLPEVWEQVNGENIKVRFEIAPSPLHDDFDPEFEASLEAAAEAAFDRTLSFTVEPQTKTPVGFAVTPDVPNVLSSAIPETETLEDRWHTILAKIAEIHPRKIVCFQHCQSIALEANKLNAFFPRLHARTFLSSYAAGLSELFEKLWREHYGQRIEFQVVPMEKQPPQYERDYRPPAMSSEDFENAPGIAAALARFEESLNAED